MARRTGFYDPISLQAFAFLIQQVRSRDAMVEKIPERLAALVPTALVRRHLLGPLAYRAGLAQFRNDFIASALLADVRARTLLEVIEAFCRRSIPVILFKGISYADVLYTDPAERPMSDIDLLVPVPWHTAAAQELRRLGYWKTGSNRQASRFHHAVCFKRKDAAIDLHRSVMQPFRSRIDVDSLWDRAVPVARSASASGMRALSNVFRLTPFDEAILHLAHIARHELRVPCINYIDAERLLEQIPGERAAVHIELIRRASQFRIGRAITAALAATHAVTRGAPPSVDSFDTHEEFVLDSVRRRILPSCWEILGDPPLTRPLQLLRKFALVDGPRELAGLLFVGAHGKLAHLFRA